MKTLSWSRRAFMLPFLLSLSALPAPCAGTAVPENWEARQALRDTIFAPVRQAASQRQTVILQQTAGTRVSFQAETQAGALYLVFANQAGKGFPLSGPGTFIIKRSLKDGSFVQAKVFIQDDPGCFLRLFPRGDRTLMDIFLFGEPHQQGILLPVSFDRLLTSPIARIQELSGRTVDWSLVLPSPGTSDDMRLAAIVSALRQSLPSLRDEDDGAMDGDGRLVYIATGLPAPKGRGGFNCSGFAKWVVDGFYKPLTGRYTDIATLKQRSLEYRGNAWSSRYEEERDPYFGLDWTRNLARAIAEARTGVPLRAQDLDVRDTDRFPYIEDVGYPLKDLHALLYSLARRNPGTIYLGSVNGTAADGPAASSPPGVLFRSGEASGGGLRQHHHVVVLLPYLDENGSFQAVVMERNGETSIGSLRARYGSQYIHLVRVEPGGVFAPPRID